MVKVYFGRNYRVNLDFAGRLQTKVKTDFAEIIDTIILIFRKSYRLNDCWIHGEIDIVGQIIEVLIRREITERVNVDFEERLQSERMLISRQYYGLRKY